MFSKISKLFSGHWEYSSQGGALWKADHTFTQYELDVAELAFVVLNFPLIITGFLLEKVVTGAAGEYTFVKSIRFIEPH